MSFRPGELDEKIDLLKPVYKRNGIGGRDREYTVVTSKISAKVKPVSGSESNTHDHIVGKSKYIFVIRNRRDLEHQYIIRWKNINFNITHIPFRGHRPLYLIVEAESDVTIQS